MKHLSIRRAVIALFALVGLLDALYLSIERLTNQAMACPTSGGCEAVQASSYSAIFGIPVAFIGVVGYSIMLMLAMMSLSGVAWGRISAAMVLAAVALAGVLFSGYLVYLQLAVIHAVCFWCMLSATMEVGIAALAGADLLRAGRGDAPPEELPAH